MTVVVARRVTSGYDTPMRSLLVTCASILTLLLVASALYVRLPGYAAVGLALFGGCLGGLGAFGWYIAMEEKKRSHHH